MPRPKTIDVPVRLVEVPATAADIRHRFTNHPPRNGNVASVLDAITRVMTSAGVALAEALPDSREKAMAITKLEECSMWAKAAVARNQDAPQLSDEPMPTDAQADAHDAAHRLDGP